jgi:hypothetical protein
VAALEVASPAADPSAEESALLDRARASRRENPTEALWLTELHALRFPHGRLWVEREIVAIDTLAALARSAEARARLQALVAHASDSPGPPPLDAPAQERAILGLAQHVSAEDALGLTSFHAARFPGSALWLERELLAIDALLMLARDSEAGARARALVGRASDPPRPSAEEAPVQESSLLSSAQRWPGASPEAVLALTDVHAARFPDSQRWGEREALAIGALHRLGRAADARARVEAFISRASVRPGLPGREAPTEELALIQVARELRRASPDETLRLAELHAARHPDGAPWLERELLAIDALVRLRRQGDARVRAKALLARASHGRRAPDGLSAEVMLVDYARSALFGERDGAEEALWLTDVHAAWFPDGALRPEREVLALHALVGVGRAADARARASALLARPHARILDVYLEQFLQRTR